MGFNMELQAALVTAAATVVGVILGAGVQHVVSSLQVRKLETRSLASLAYMIADLRRVYEEMGDGASVFALFAQNTRMPTALTEHLPNMIRIATEHAPALTMPLVWIREATLNFDTYYHDAEPLFRSDDPHSNAKIKALVARAVTQLTAAKKYSRRALLLCYALLPRRDRWRLRQDEYFGKFWHEVQADLSPVQRVLASSYLVAPPISDAATGGQRKR